MASSATAPESPPPAVPEAAENSLQVGLSPLSITLYISSPSVFLPKSEPFFVLHKASTSKKSARKHTGTPKTRRRIELSENGEDLGAEKDGEIDDRDNVNMRMEAFETVWSGIESTFKGVLRDMNTNVFNEIHQWVRDSFNAIVSLGVPSFAEATRSFPILTDATSKRLFTGLVLTKNVEFVDDLVTFEELGLHLKSQGCHVANLSSLDFSLKNGIGGCLRSLLRQFLMVSLDTADMSILATWYREQGSTDKPVVVIIDDMERCCGSVLSEFIVMLRYHDVYHPPTTSTLFEFLITYGGGKVPYDAK
ncbi:hypothetical protein Tsubulata_043760 [Turnera subulata]|uniref:Origin recognition complex subunit 3 N-terminal domain-containing protein n=1 Tax=Turnera subulata TaxID=218843 RepID=A0A9Q0GCD4_9ROSI|nr:hypothetical protein Tsubulata_043760 [Turnera subulata]